MAKKTSRAKAVDPTAVFKTLSDLNRFRTIDMLSNAKRGLLVGDIASALRIGHSAASHLLGSLHTADIVSFAKEGRTVRYFLSGTPQAKAVLRVKRAA